MRLASPARMAFAVTLAALALSIGTAAPFLAIASTRAAAAARKPASKTAPKPAPIASFGERSVEALDIQRAAQVLGNDPLRARSPTQWRRMLLDRCVDRELLSMEAARLGLGNDPVVRRRSGEYEYQRLSLEIYEKFLIPGIEPTNALLDSLRATGIYRLMDLHYIVLLDDPKGTNRELAAHLLARIRNGASFDSMAKVYSAHPTGKNGGHFGPTLVRDLAAASYKDLKDAKVGDIFGVYTAHSAHRSFHQIYKVGGFQELSADSMRNLVRNDRTNSLHRLYLSELLARYHFRPDSSMEKAVLFAVGSETRDSILASLGPDGSRPRRGARPALGVLARVDGDSMTFVDLLREARLTADSTGHLHIEDAAHLREDLARAFYRRLVVRDAKDRGLLSDPLIARELRMARDETAVRVMVERARPPDPDRTALASYFEARESRYQRPAAWTGRVGVFESRDSAAAALRAWNGAATDDSSFHARGLREQPRATSPGLLPGRTAKITFFEPDRDPLGHAVQLVADGQFTPVVETLQGFAVAQVIGREPARPYTLEEVIDRVRRDWREEKENEWVLRQLERIRARTPIQIVPSRLQAVKIGTARAAGRGAGAVTR